MHACAVSKVDGPAVTYSTCDGYHYLCHPHHRDPGRRVMKSQWAIERKEECTTFCETRRMASQDDPAGVWYIGQDAYVVIGQDQERMAFFREPVNPNDPWHGYPVGGTRARGRKRMPPDSLILSWLKTGHVSRHVADKIRRGVL